MIDMPAIVQPAEGFGIVRLINAIGEVESGNDDNAIGKKGERGRFQFTRELWAEFSRMPFERAHCRGCSEAAMGRLMISWHHDLALRGVAMNMRAEIIVQWFECGKHGLVTPAKRDAIQRILNLYRQ